MNSDDDAQGVHHNVFYGPASIGGHQYLNQPPTAATPQRGSSSSQAWGYIVAAWALSPLATWLTHRAPSGPPKILEIVHDAAPYVLLAGGLAVGLDVAAFLAHRRWALVQRATNHPMTWKRRLLAALIGCFGLVAFKIALSSGSIPRIPFHQ